MAKEIYSQSVFEKQVNGTIFQKEGRLQDFPYAGEGVFESWRYSFDAGKQVFRASNSGKVFEKRIIKDIQGNPKWTTWVEIPDAEAHGIQAIAVNDRPLQLPNSDGAIKLQITPQMIDSYTKSEIYSLIDQKITEDLNKNYIYVPWFYSPDGTAASTPKQVLQLTYPDGGIKEQYYLVEPHQGTSGILEDVSFWIWDYRADINKDDWMEVNTPDMKAFVSYPVFKEHTNDGHLHLSGQFEREYWNQKVNPEDMEAAISGSIANKFDEVNTRLDEHLADIDDPLSPHVTPQERESWNTAAKSSIPMPEDGLRYVSLDGTYERAYEQIQLGDEARIEVLPQGTFSGEDDAIIIDGLYNQFNLLSQDNKQLLKTRIEFGSLATSQAHIYFETNTGIQSPEWTTNSGGQVWEIDYKVFDSITLKCDKPNHLVSISNLRIHIYYKPIKYVVYGDPEQRLQLNLIGPEYNKVTQEGSILYNGEPLQEVFSEAAHTADWGRISGDINTQEDLNMLLASVVKNKVNAAPMDSHLRYDVYKDSIIPSLIQQPGLSYQTYVLNNHDMGKDPVTGLGIGIPKDSIVFENVKQLLVKALEDGFVPYSILLQIQYVASYNDTNGHPISVYFETDNPEIELSPRVGSSEFSWKWPGDTYKIFDKIYLRGNDAQYFDQVKLVVECIQYGDWILQASGYQGTINGTNLFVNSSGLFELNSENTTLNTSGLFELNTLKGVVNVSGLLDIETLGTHINSSGLLHLESDNTHIDSREGQFISESRGATINAKDAAIQMTSSSGLQINLGNSDLRSTSDRVLLSVKDKTVIHSNNEFRVSGKLIKLNAEETAIDSEYSPYDEAENIVKIHGEEADERYAPRPEYETVSGIVSGLVYTKVDKDLVGESGIIQDITFEFDGDETRGSLLWKKNVVSLHDGTIETISGIYDIVTEQELKEHYDELSGFIDEDRYDIAKEIKERTEAVSGEVYNREIADQHLQDQIDYLSGDIDDNYYTKDETDLIISGEVFERKSEDENLQNQIDAVVTDLDDNYYTKTEIDKIHGDDQESFDITINDVAELKEFLTRHSPSVFEQSARILFKSGVYDLETDFFDDEPLDFSNIKYIKGEWPCTVNIYSDDMLSPINFEGTVFENIIFNIGPVGNQQIFNGGAKRIKTIILDTPTKMVELDPIYDIYRFIMEADCEVSFTEVITGKEYFFWIDQPHDPTYKFTTTNYFHNAESELFNSSLENQIPGKRTVLILMGNNETQKNGFIEHEIIYGVESDIAEGKKIKIKLGNIKAQLLNSTVMVKFVHNIVGTGSYTPGSTITIKSQFVNSGWEHNDTDDFIITCDTTTLTLTPIGGGPTRIGTDVEFKLPTEGEINAIYGGIREFTLDFKAKATEVIVKLDHIAYYTPDFNFIKVENGYYTVENQEIVFGRYQPGYTGENVSINFQLNKDHHLFRVYATKTNGDIYLDDNQHTTPWNFKITEVPADNTIWIVPVWYEKIHTDSNYKIDITVHNPGIGNHGSTEVLRGLVNNINFNTVPAHALHNSHGDKTVPDSIELSLAPIVILPLDPTVVEVSTTFKNDGTQVGTIKVTDPTVTSIQFTLSWPGQTPAEANVIYEFDVIEKISAGDIIIEDLDTNFNFLHTGVVKKHEVNVHIDWESPEPTYKEGTWSIVGSTNAEIVSSNKDTAVMRANTKGLTTIQFIADFDQSKFSKTFEIIVHANAIEIVDPGDVLTSPPPFEAQFNFLDENGVIVDKTLLSNPLGVTWDSLDTTAATVIDESAGTFNILPNYLPHTGEIYVISDMYNLDANFEPDNRMEDTLIFNIVPNSYKLSVKNDNSTVIPNGITPSEGNIFDGGEYIVLFVHFKDGYKATDTFKDELISFLQDPVDLETIRDLPGLYEVKIRMPCRDIEVVATGKEI